MASTMSASLIILFIPINSQSYFKGPSDLSWLDAQQFCQRRQTTLASIHSQSDFNEAISICDNLGEHTCWLGLNDIDQTGIYQWDDGTATDFGFVNNSEHNPTNGIYPWALWYGSIREPNSDGENCIQMSKWDYSTASVGDEWRWNDQGCNGQYDIWRHSPLCNVPS